MGERARESRPGLLDESKGTEMCTDTEGGTGEMALNLRALQVQRLRFESQYPHGSPPCFFTPILRDLTPSPGLFRHQACKWFTDRHVVKAPRCIKLQTKLSRTSREGARGCTSRNPVAELTGTEEAAQAAVKGRLPVETWDNL